jgi:Negative regulator of sigma F
MKSQDMYESSPNPPENLLRRIETTMLSDLQPVKPVETALRTSLGLLAFAVLVAVAAIGRLGWAGLSASSGVQASVVLGILVVSMSWLAQSLSEQMVPGSRRQFSPVLLLVLPPIAIVVALLMLFPSEPGANFFSAGLRCWKAGVACAAATAPLFWLKLRRGYALFPIQQGATAGLLAGLTGVMVLTIECRYVDTPHLTTWHLGAGLAAMAIGACIGYFARSRRRRAA